MLSDMCVISLPVTKALTVCDVSVVVQRLSTFS
jgi:hypothetical protein